MLAAAAANASSPRAAKEGDDDDVVVVVFILQPFLWSTRLPDTLPLPLVVVVEEPLESNREEVLLSSSSSSSAEGTTREAKVLVNVVESGGRDERDERVAGEAPDLNLSCINVMFNTKGKD